MFNAWNLVIILVIVVVLFGTKKLRNIGKDLGGAIKGFKDATKGEDKGDDKKPEDAQIAKSSAEKTDDNVIEGEATREEKKG